MKIGFTGTRTGMSEAQKSELTKALRKYMSRAKADETMEFHHGGCEGADLEAGDVAYKLGYKIVVHPGGATLLPGLVKSRDRVLPERPNLKRNQDIVDAADVMLAAPATDIEQQRSGTWATIRASRRSGKPIRVMVR